MAGMVEVSEATAHTRMLGAGFWSGAHHPAPDPVPGAPARSEPRQTSAQWSLTNRPGSLAKLIQAPPVVKLGRPTALQSDQEKVVRRKGAEGVSLGAVAKEFDVSRSAIQRVEEESRLACKTATS